MLKTLLFIALLTFLPSTFAQYNVIFINPGHANTNVTGPFWYEVSQLMRDAAEDFDLNLTIHYANRNHILMKELVADAVKQSPDMLILVDEKSVLSQQLLNLPTFNTPVYFLLNRPTGNELRALKNKGMNIAGSVVPDNVQAGHLLAKQLISKAQLPASIYAINGDHTTPAALDRKTGLEAFTAQHAQVNIAAQGVANWSSPQAYRQSLGLLTHHPDIQVIWSANDAMALGAIRALNEKKRRTDVLVGAINWPLRAAAEKIDVCIGGHVTLGALAMINIHAILENPKHDVLHQKMAIFRPHTEETLEFVEQIHSNSLAINFKVFSKAQKTPRVFSIESLLDEASKNAL